MEAAHRPSNFQDVLAKLTSVKKCGAQYEADCPAPGHKTPSGHLSVRDAGDRALVHCFPGPHTYEQICTAMGFETLNYSHNSSDPAPAPIVKLNDKEAMAILKKIYGLNDDTIKHFDIKPDYSRQAWKYPVKGGTRFKKYDRIPPKKYWHSEGTPNQLYGLADIPKGTQRIWLLNGEPAIWLAKQTKIAATCGIWGEGKLPDNAIPELKSRGVQIIELPYDLDPTGKRSAVAEYHVLKNAFTLHIRRLPDVLGSRADICDLFKLHRCDSDTFRHALGELPEVPVTELEDEIKKQTINTKGLTSLICMADVKSETVTWLWLPYIALGKLTLLEGDPGVGKSWLSLTIASAVSKGNGLPGATPYAPSKVILASAEDGLGDTLRPRLDAVGANVASIHAIKGPLDFSNGGISTLTAYIEHIRPALVIVDPLVAYMGASVDIHRANQTRAIMAQLADIAEKYGVAILAVRHLTKGGTLKPIYRGIGSIDFTAACRSVLLAGCDQEDAQKRGLVHIKSNLAPMGAALGYEIDHKGFHWTGNSNLTAEQMLSAEDEEKKSAIEEAVLFLTDELSDGRVESSQVFKDAKNMGISETTIKRAKSSLGIVSEREGEPGKKGGGQWFCRLPDTTDKCNGDLEGQEGHIKNSDPLNKNSFKSKHSTPDVDPLNSDSSSKNSQSTDVANQQTDGEIPVSIIIDFWVKEGKPVVHLGPGENCSDLEKLLSNPHAPQHHIKAVKEWYLSQRKTKGV